MDYKTDVTMEDFVRETTDFFDDAVHHPPHYGQGKIECIDYISDFLTKPELIGYLRGNVAKYLHRWPYKNGLQDLNKAAWYLDRLIAVVEEQNDGR